VPRDRLDRGLERLRARYQVRVSDGVYAATGFLAGDDRRRIDELNGYLRDPEVRAILVGRGGYGILRIVEQLDADALRRDPKPIVGFSDATVLLSWALRAGVRPVHGPVVAQLGELAEEDCRWLYRLLEDPNPAGPIAQSLTPMGADRTGVIEGPIVGGNLSVVVHLLGTRFAVDFRGAIALFEDVDEPPYAVDRYFTHLKLADALAGCRAAALGEFTNCNGRGCVDQVLDERLRAMSLPALRGLRVGHGTSNLAVPYGGRCALDFDRASCELLDAAVA
jgi:muramoyltetrapeptide carboxypeptidase